MLHGRLPVPRPYERRAIAIGKGEPGPCSGNYH